MAGTSKKKKQDRVFAERLGRHHDELRWLYMELYGNDDMFAELCDQMKWYYDQRNDKLKKLDAQREAEGEWYRKRDMLGMMMYIDNFAGNIKGVQEKLPYLEKCNVNYVHLMPFLDSPKGRSDGGYAVADFRKVKPELGTMEDLAALAEKCHEKGISLCMDFVMNHTSEDHEWAKRARQGDGEYMSRYFFYADPAIPREYEKTVPQVFPTTAPGNFTYLPEMGHYVMTTFYPYQWDLNYSNPRVFNEMMYNFLYLANQGMDIIRIDAVPYIWKQLGTNCRNLPQVHTIVRMMRMIGEIVCPGIVLLGEVVMEPKEVAPYFGTVEKPECHMLYSGDEIGQVNDYTYKEDPDKAPDSRYIHRGKFCWELTEHIKDKDSVQGRIFNGLEKLEKIRRTEAVFDADAEVYTKDYSDNSILWIVRRSEGEELHAVFNFSDQGRTIWMPEKGKYTNLVTGVTKEVETVELSGWDFVWMKR